MLLVREVPWASCPCAAGRTIMFMGRMPMPPAWPLRWIGRNLRMRPGGVGTLRRYASHSMDDGRMRGGPGPFPPSDPIISPTTPYPRGITIVIPLG